MVVRDHQSALAHQADRRGWGAPVLGCDSLQSPPHSCLLRRTRHLRRRVNGLARGRSRIGWHHTVEIRSALEGLFSASAAGGTERTGERLECVACGVGLPAELQQVAAKGFMVVVQDFQDPYTLDVRKLRKCCVAEIVPDGRLILFCAYNSVGYREQLRAELSAAGRNGSG
jgi:hypothetical protein